MRFYEMEEEQVGGGEEEEEEEVVVVGSTSKKDGGGVRVGWSPYERVVKMASGNAVVVFSVSGCCMCHVVKRLLLGLGVGPIVYELDQIDGGVSREVEAVLSQLLSSSTTTVTSAGATSAVVVEGPSVGGGAAVPAVFIGGKLLGGVEKVMACHINGSLVPLLKQAGALWL